MKVLIPVDNERVAPRFGTAKRLLVFEIDNNGIREEEDVIDVKSKGAFEKAKLIKDGKIDAVVCLGIENWIFHYLNGFKIKVFPGVNGMVKDVIARFASGNLKSIPIPVYGFTVIQRGMYRRGRKGHGVYHNGHFRNRFI